jgi:ribosomal protein S18 acetylase RimI-like enzyme
MVQLVQVMREGDDLDTIRTLFREYGSELNENLCFQGFDAELATPLKKYGPPGGVIFLALWEGEAAGCIALTPLKAPGECEMKRLYVRPGFRQHGIGRVLVDALLAEARKLNYTVMKLDTLKRLGAAIKLYEQYGFGYAEAYYENPLGDVVYMEKKLE